MQDQLRAMEELFRQLPPENRREVQSYIEFLIAKQEARARRPPRFDWAGALSELQGQYSSVELQHQISDWRGEAE
jgi:hypothetical protein